MLRFHLYAVAVLSISSAFWGLPKASLAQTQDTPTILDNRIRKVELFAELDGAFGFDAVINDGINGFPRGLLVTSGPGRTVSRQIWQVSETGTVTQFVDGLQASEGLAFGPGGSFGTDLFVSEPRFPRVIKVDSSGNVSSFATNFTAPFGPAGLAFGPGGAFGTDLFVADLSGNRIVTVDSSGIVTTFTSFAPGPHTYKAAAFDTEGWYNYLFFTTIFTGNLGGDSVVSVDSNGNATPFSTGLTGAELITFDEKGLFGFGMFLATIGDISKPKDGSISFVDMHGNIEPFLGNVDATKIVFDNEGVLGGGAFVVAGSGDGKLQIWHLTPEDNIDSRKVPEPNSALAFLALGILGMSSTLKRKLKPSQSTEKETTKVG